VERDSCSHMISCQALIGCRAHHS